MKTWYVYKHTNIITGMSYIGITCKPNPKERWGGKGQRYRKDQPKLYYAIQKYGWENFTHEILYKGLPHDDAVQKEKEMIRKYDSIANGYNITEGGEGALGRVCTEATKIKMRQTLGDKTRGQNNHFYGKKHTDETKRKISQANKGKPGLKGPANPSYGTHPVFTEEHKMKIKETQRKNMIPVVLYSLKTKTIIQEFESIKQASRITGVDKNQIRKECKRSLNSKRLRKDPRFIFKKEVV